MKPVRPILMAALVAVVVSPSHGQNLEPAPAGPKAPKPTPPALVEVKDAPGLKRVLLIGDSISMGYTLPVREKLKGIANVHRPLENCGDTERGLSRLDQWLGPNPWDVIHFNFGLHDLKYVDAKGALVSPDQGQQVAAPEVYARRLRELTRKLKATQAKLIFATTTPVPPGSVGRVAGDEKTYNQVALEVMKELDVLVDDLWAYVAGQQKKIPPRPLEEKAAARPQLKPRPGEIQLPFNVHFTPEGYDQLAERVAASIKNAK